MNIPSTNLVKNKEGNCQIQKVKQEWIDNHQQKEETILYNFMQI